MEGAGVGPTLANGGPAGGVGIRGCFSLELLGAAIVVSTTAKKRIKGRGCKKGGKKT